MLTKPVAMVLLIAAVVIAAFVGGYVYKQFNLTEASDEFATLGEAEPTPASGGASTTGTPPGRARAGGGGPTRARLGGGTTSPSSDAGGQPTSAPGAGADPAGGAPAGTPARATRTPIVEDLVVPAGTIITIQLVAPLSSETAKVEDPAEAVIAENVTVDQIVAVPAGTKVLGSVTIAEKGGKVKEPARVGVRFHTLVLASGAEVLLTIDPLVQEGVAPSGRSKVAIGGGAAIGVGLGWLLGGTEGAIKGGVTGVGGGTAATMMSKAQPAIVPKGAQARVRLIAPITVRVERE